MIHSLKKFIRPATIAGLAAALSWAPAVQAAPPGELPFGVYDPDGHFTSDPDVQIEHLFLPWEDVFLPSLVDADNYALERNRALLVTIEPWTWTRTERNSPDVLQAALESGRYDRFMRGICAVLGTMDSSVTVRWAQEMEDESGQFIWAGWNPETYITAYKRMVDICREEAPDLRYMWSPLGYEDLADYYPGDDYVDVVGLSVFGLQAWEQQQFGRPLTFAEILEPRYERAAQFDKPIVVAELGFLGDQEYLETWTNDVRQSLAQFPRLVGVVYFNQKEVYPWPGGFGMPDWRDGIVGPDEQVPTR